MRISSETERERDSEQLQTPMVTIALCPLPSPHILCQLTGLPTLTDGSFTLPEIAWSRNSSLQPVSYRAAHQWLLFVNTPSHRKKAFESPLAKYHLGKSSAYLSKLHQHSPYGHTPWNRLVFTVLYLSGIRGCPLKWPPPPTGYSQVWFPSDTLKAHIFSCPSKDPIFLKLQSAMFFLDLMSHHPLGCVTSSICLSAHA